MGHPKKKKTGPFIDMDPDNTQRDVPHWNVDPHDLSGKLHRKYIRKPGTPRRRIKHGQPDIYCLKCKREHWGPCNCVICGKPGHDEDKCPELKDQEVEDPELSAEYYGKLRREKLDEGQASGIPKVPKKPQRLFCTFCEQNGHNEKKCPVREEMLAEKQKNQMYP